MKLSEPEYNTHIVVVDDEQSILRSIERLLIDTEFELHCFTDAREALAFCQDNTVALVLSDVRMPGMDGIEFMTLLANDQEMTERVLLTGFSDIESTVGAINKGRISYYVDKPWDDERLLRIISKGVQNTNVRIRNAYLESLTKEQNAALTEWNETLEAKVASRTEKLRASYLSATQTLSALVDKRLSATEINNARIADLVTNIGRHLSLDENGVQDLGIAALLCQVGKMSFNDHLLQGAQLSFNHEELSLFHKHPCYCEAALVFAPPLAGVASILKQHKEVLDGSGYPEGLDGTQIELGALILGLVTRYAESVNGQYFERQLTHSEARDHLLSLAETQYPADLVDITCQVLDEWQKQQLAAPENCLAIRKLAPGMTLTRDIVAPNGVLVLARDKQLDQHLIDNLQQLESSLNVELEAYVSAFED